MPRGKFLLYTASGAALWNAVLICLGAFAGSKWERILQYTDVYSEIAIALMAICAIGLIIWIKRKRRVRKKE